jgi:hypothetical protein
MSTECPLKVRALMFVAKDLALKSGSLAFAVLAVIGGH